MMPDTLKTVVSQNKFCDQCGSEITEGSSFCESCGADLTGEKPKKSRKTIKAIVVSLIALIAICVLSIAFVRLNNPFIQLQSALKNTVNAKSAEFKIQVNSDYDDVNFDGEIELDIKDKYFCLHVDLDDEGDGWIKYENSDIAMCHKDSDGHLETDNVPKEVEKMFDSYFDILSGNVDSDAINNLMGNSIYDDIFEASKLKTEGKKLLKKLSSKENMKNLLGYSKEKDGSDTIHSFSPDIYKIVLFLIDEGEDIFTQKGYEQIKKIKDEDVDLEDISKFKIKLITTGKYFIGYELQSDEMNMKFKISNINKASVDFPK